MPAFDNDSDNTTCLLILEFYLIFMKIYEITARDYKTGTPITVKWNNYAIIEVNPVENEDVNDLWIAPSLFDLQINGFASVDFQDISINAESLINAINNLQQSCCSKFLLTLITDRWDRLIEKIKRLKELRYSNDILKNSIVGWHIEGPFLSEKIGFCGTHNPSLMIDPKPDYARQLRKILPDDLILLTVAPERNGAIEFIKNANELGIIISLGHTDAPYEILKMAVNAGARGFTHLGNGCPQFLERKDNILWRVLDIENIKITLIPDTIHVSPPLFRLIHKVKNEIIYISDAISGAGAPPGVYNLGDIEITVDDNGVIWNPTKTGYAGSSLRPFDGILKAMKMLNCNWQNLWERYSELPAEFLGIKHGIYKNCMADFLIIKTSKSNIPEPVEIVVSGQPKLLNNSEKSFIKTVN